MNALSVMDADLKALMNVKTAVLVNMPLLKKLTLRAAFIHAEEGIVWHAGEFEKRKELKGLEFFEEYEEWGQRVVDSMNYKEEIDLRRAEESKERAEKRLKQKENIDILRAEKSLARAIARITLAQG